MISSAKADDLFLQFDGLTWHINAMGTSYSIPLFDPNRAVAISHDIDKATLSTYLEGPGALSFQYVGLSSVKLFLNGEIQGSAGQSSAYFLIPEGSFDAVLEIVPDKSIIPGLGGEFLPDHAIVSAGYQNNYLVYGTTHANTGGLVLTSSEEYRVDPRTVVTFSAEPDPFNHFVRWAFPYEDEPQEFDLEIVSDTNVVARFGGNENIYGMDIEYEGAIPFSSYSQLTPPSGVWIYNYTEGDQGVRSVSLQVEGPTKIPQVPQSLPGLQTKLLIDEVEQTVTSSFQPYYIPKGAHTIKWEITINPDKLGFERWVQFPFPEFYPEESYSDWWDLNDTSSTATNESKKPKYDFDHDGLSNYLEYLIGGNPVRNDSYIEIRKESKTEELILSYYKLPAWMQYGVEIAYTDNLSNPWKSASNILSESTSDQDIKHSTNAHILFPNTQTNQLFFRFMQKDYPPSESSLVGKLE